ncbi:hypothetical protein ACPPVO_02200 [Dactylosporangium sp. McL0621]|uniref:hypothetical protein n=1 Tax=Dactylosporangium sp. McL0621 TaxID=3415678 RepID=UPI003CEC4898
MLTILGGVSALVIGRLGDSPAAPPRSPKYISCMYAGQAGDQGYCDRYVADVARRGDLTQEQRDRLDADMRKAERAVQTPLSCADVLGQAPSGRFAECEGLPVPVRSDRGVRNRALSTGDPAADLPSFVEAIRVSLERAGYPGGTVRAARADDPAPRGTIMFGVPIAEACFVGYEAVPSGGGGYGLQGKLPDGRCLSA